jgi:hypothetical protein
LGLDHYFYNILMNCDFFKEYMHKDIQSFIKNCVICQHTMYDTKPRCPLVFYNPPSYSSQCLGGYLVRFHHGTAIFQCVHSHLSGSRSDNHPPVQPLTNLDSREIVASRVTRRQVLQIVSRWYILGRSGNLFLYPQPWGQGCPLWGRYCYVHPTTT